MGPRMAEGAEWPEWDEGWRSQWWWDWENRPDWTPQQSDDGSGVDDNTGTEGCLKALWDWERRNGILLLSGVVIGSILWMKLLAHWELV